jgi:HAD superfamily hydrolase (TIGR01490 family)
VSTDQNELNHTLMQELLHIPPIADQMTNQAINIDKNYRSIKVAFFDLDRTLIDYNSGQAWAYEEWKAGFLNVRQLMKVCYWLLKYHWGMTDLEAAIHKSIALLKGHSEDEFSKRMANFYEQQVSKHYRPEALKLIRYFQSHNIPIVLLTTSSSYLSSHVQKDLGLQDILANYFEVEHGFFTGKVKGSLCFAEGKLYAAESYLKDSEIDLQSCAFYTDSYADLALLSEIGFPYVVCPDRRLKTWAEINQKPILQWSKAESIS